MSTHDEIDPRYLGPSAARQPIIFHVEIDGKSAVTRGALLAHGASHLADLLPESGVARFEYGHPAVELAERCKRNFPENDVAVRMGFVA